MMHMKCLKWTAILMGLILMLSGLTSGTVNLQIPQTPVTEVATISVDPTFRTVTSPFWLTIATAGLVEAQRIVVSTPYDGVGIAVN